MSTPQPEFRGLGVEQRVDPGQTQSASDRFDADVELASRHGFHIWTAIASHRLSDRQAEMMAGVSPDPEALPHLDTESLIGVYVGCFICEEPLDPRLLKRSCRGQPKGSRR